MVYSQLWHWRILQLHAEIMLDNCVNIQFVGGYPTCIKYFTSRFLVVCVCLWLFVALSGFYDFLWLPVALCVFLVVAMSSMSKHNRRTFHCRL